jgi:hypothetical protein
VKKRHKPTTKAILDAESGCKADKILDREPYRLPPKDPVTAPNGRHRRSGVTKPAPRGSRTLSDRKYPQEAP